MIRYVKNETVTDEMVDGETFDCWVDSEKMGLYVTFGDSKRVRLVKKSCQYRKLVEGMNRLYRQAESGFVDLTAEL